jgi:hypothetical protein
MTSNRGAGFSSAPRAGSAGRFDPLGAGAGRSPLAAGGGGGGGGAAGGGKKAEASPEEAARDMERRVHALLEESAAAHARGEEQQGGRSLRAAPGLVWRADWGAWVHPQKPGLQRAREQTSAPARAHEPAALTRPHPPRRRAALEKALEARRRERALSKFRDSNSVPDYGGPELGFAVELQAAAMHAANRLWQEALDRYAALVRNKAVPQAPRRAGPGDGAPRGRRATPSPAAGGARDKACASQQAGARAGPCVARPPPAHRPAPPFPTPKPPQPARQHRQRLL